MTRPGGENRGLFERPKGVWWVRYADEYGREHREKVGRKKLAQTVYTRRKAAVIERRFTPDLIRRRDMTVVQAIADALERAKGKRASFRDMKRYADRWVELLGHRPLRQLTPGDVERIEARRRQAGASQYLLYQELSFLRRVYTLAIKDGAADRNPVLSVRPVRERRIRYLTDAEEVALLAKIEPAQRPLVLFAIHTGLRAGEQFQLKWAYVDLAAKVVRLPKTKSGRPRDIPLNEVALAALRRVPRHLKSPWVFRGERLGLALNHSHFSKTVFRPAIQQAKLVGLRWNDLRHTFASRLAMEGVDLYTIAELLGHRDLQMVQRYAHLSPAHRSRAVAVLSSRKRTGTRTGTSVPKGERSCPQTDKSPWFPRGF